MVRSSLLMMLIVVLVSGCAIWDFLENQLPVPEPEYSVSGVVTDGETGIEGVVISFSPYYSPVMTLADGSWTKPELAGTVTVTASKDGWTFEPDEIDVHGENTEVDFVGTSSGEPTADILFFSDFSDGDPLELEPAKWTTVSIPANAEYTYVAAENYVNIDAQPSKGFTFGLLQTDPSYLYWDRNLGDSYTVEALLRFDRLAKFQTLSFRLQGFNIGYVVVLGVWNSDEYNVSLGRQVAWNEPIVVVADDGNACDIFNDGAIKAEYRDQWVPVKVVFQGGHIEVYVNDVKLMQWYDEDPLERFSFAVNGYANEVSVGSVSITKIED